MPTRLTPAIRASLMIVLTLAIAFLPNALRPADAQSVNVASTTLEFAKDATRMTYTLDERSAIALSGGDLDLNGTLDEYEFEAVKPMFEALLEDQLRLTIDGEEAEWTNGADLRLDADGPEKQAVLVVELPPVAADAAVALTDRLYEGITRFDYRNALTVMRGEPIAAVLSGSNRTWRA